MENDTIKELYDNWVSRVCSFLMEEGPKYNLPCGTFQSKPILDKQPNVVFLGFNPHEPGVFSYNLKERFYNGNASFYSAEVETWPVWKPLHDFFEWAGYTNPTEDGRFVFFNAIYFGTKNIYELKRISGINEAINKCLKYTGEVIQDIFKPKCVVCLSVPNCFDILNRFFHFSNVKRVNTIQETDDEIIEFAMNKECKGWKIRYNCKRVVKKGLWNNIPVYGIPHPSGRVSNDDFGAIALYLRSEMQKMGI